MKYSEKLKNPKWQKMRLKVLERDEWKCRSCSDSDSMLSVHHHYYNGAEPWDYPMKALITLCQECHELERDTRSEYEHLLLRTLKEAGFLSDDVRELATCFIYFQDRHIRTHSNVLRALQWFFEDSDQVDKMVREWNASRKKSNG